MKKDEEDFIKKITEIIDSIKKGECTVPIKDVPEGKETNKNGVTDNQRSSDTDMSSIQRSRTGSLKQSSKDEAIIEGAKDQMSKDTVSSGLKMADRKDVATSMSPLSSLDSSRPKRRFEISEGSKPLVITQSSNDSVSYTMYTVSILYILLSL